MKCEICRGPLTSAEGPPICSKHPRERDVRMMQEPWRWVTGPRLPLKRLHPTEPNAWPELGYLETDDSEGSVSRVHWGNCFTAKKADNPAHLYPNFGAIYDDGWRVD